MSSSQNSYKLFHVIWVNGVFAQDKAPLMTLSFFLKFVLFGYTWKWNALKNIFVVVDGQNAFILFVYFYVVLRIESSASHMLGKHSITEL